MMKKNKLYTMRKGMPAMFVNRQSNNIFDGFFGGSNLSLGNGLSPDILGGYKTTVPGTVQKIDWTNPVQRAAAVGTSAGLVSGFSDAANAINPFNQSSASTGGLNNFFSSKNFGKGTMGAGLLNAGANFFGNIAGNAISGGLSSGAGNAVSTLGSTAGNIVSNFNPVAGAAVTFASNLVGGTLNRAFGSKLNEQKIAEVEGDISKLDTAGSQLGAAKDYSTLTDTFSNTELNQNFTQDDIGEDGWFSSKAKDKYEELKRRQEAAKLFTLNSFSIGANNIDRNKTEQLMANSVYSLGGLLNGNKKGNKMNKFGLGGEEENIPQFLRYAGLIKPSQMGLIPSPSYPAYSANNYEGDYLKTRMLSEKAKRPTAHPLLDRGYNSSSQLGDALKQATLENEENIRKVAEFNRATDRALINSAGPSKMGQPLFALGGDIQMHGADFSTGLSHIDAGGSHEENPNDGVQMGVDSEGTPNLVEEGETVWNDYVFSNRILADDATKQMFKLPKKKDVTFADISKKLEKEIAERPNDPISRSGFEAQMQTLEEQQERQKSEMEAERARAAFEALSPEEQTAVMQNAAQQEAMAQQAAEEQAIAEQQAMQQPSPEEVAMMQQQLQTGAMPQEQMIPTEESYAYGGNLFDIGGLAWIKKNHPEIKNPSAVAKALEKHMQTNKSNFYAPDDVSMFGDNSNRTYKWQFERAWNDLMPATTSLSAAEKHFNKWVKAGLSREDAFKLTHSDRIYNQYAGENRTSAKRGFDEAYTKLVKAPSAKKKVTGWKSVDPNDNTVYKTEKEAKMASYAYHQRQKQNPPVKEEAAQSAPKVEVASAAPQAKAAVASPQKGNTQTGKGQVEASAKRTTRTAPAISTSPNGINVGTFRNGTTGDWNEYGLPGLESYLIRAQASLSDPSLTEEQKTAIKQEIVDTINGIQQSYYENVVPTLNENRQNYSDSIWEHQGKYQNATGNAGFIGLDDDGRKYNKMDYALNKPEGHHTSDNLNSDTPWQDGYSGPQTWLRHMGATGNSLDNAVNWLRDMGIDYSPYNSWNIGEGDNASQLYRASIINPDSNVVEVLPDPYEEGWEERRSILPADEQETEDSFVEVDENGNPIDQRDIVPIHRNEKLRYAGLFGPAVGLGMQLAGVGKPDYGRLDAAVESIGNAHLADYKPLGNYLTYRPMDIWFEQNRMDANARATDRAIMNSTSPSRMAGLLANGYNSQLASGDLYRKALEYNDAKRERVASFNRGTDQFNAEAYNRNSQFNADALNRNRQYRAGLAMQAARDRTAGDASWYNGIYGNVAGLFRGLADLGRENYQHNQMVDLLGSGALPGITEEKLVKSGLYRYAKEGGKIKRKKNKRGLTF